MSSAMILGSLTSGRLEVLSGISPRSAAVAAYGAAALNLVAALAMLLLLKPGLPVEGSLLENRIAYLHLHRGLWWAGWLSWHAAAISLIAFYIGFAAVAARSSPLLRILALLCAVAGLAADLAAEAIYMGLAPEIGSVNFPSVERAAGLLTGYLGNGLYALAGILLVFAAARDLPPLLVWLSVPLWSAALGLSAATLAGSTRGQFWSTALLMPLFIVWTWLVGRWLSTRES